MKSCRVVGLEEIAEIGTGEAKEGSENRGENITIAVLSD